LRESLESPFFRPDRIDIPIGGEKLSQGDVLAEIAGRDSIGAVVALAREDSLRRILPTIAYTGTEFGDVKSLYSNVDRLRQLLRPLSVEVMEPTIVGSPRWWNAVVGRFNSVLARRYGSWHICVGCHVYLHAVRIPLAWKAGAERMVCGERLGHAGKTKINQTKLAVETYRRLLDEWGVKLEMPLLETDDEEAIVALTGDWEEGRRQPACVLSGNYRETDEAAVFDEERLRAYLEEYAIPATSRILAVIKDEGRADYDGITREVLG
jgi:hypothetical protein